MKNFTYHELPHQTKAVNSIVDLFKNIKTYKSENSQKNPTIAWPKDLNKELYEYITNTQKLYNNKDLSHFINLQNYKYYDIKMETGTGKTYTYTKTMFELNKYLGLNKFIIVVPSLSIKANTKNFLEDQATRIHFKVDCNYGVDINLNVVESKKNKKFKLDGAIRNWLMASINNKCLNILLINSGMINSIAKEEPLEFNLFNSSNNITEAIANINPVIIIDEPHKFKEVNKTWKNIKNLKPQLLLRYGATFDNKFFNLMYDLDAKDSFTQGLVKGVEVYTTEFNVVNKDSVKIETIDKIDTSKYEVTLIYKNKKEKEEKKFRKGDLINFSKLNLGLKIENIKANSIELSNGLELKKGNKINPYSYDQRLVNNMIKTTIVEHFKLEKELMNISAESRTKKIKPLSLFFIDDIISYRPDNSVKGEMAKYIEKCSIDEINKLLKQDDLVDSYRTYLKETLEEIENIHAGYFSKDNVSDSDKVIKDIELILHDKKQLLSINNHCRFIVSKWTLKEGWDNPNVFQITKLRSSGSETSKLQEVGRGLRLPVDEDMQRVEDRSFNLHYHVDLTEQDFAEKLIKQIDDTAILPTVIKSLIPGEKIKDEIINDIHFAYQEFSENKIRLILEENNITDGNGILLEGCEEKIGEIFPKLDETKDLKNIIYTHNKNKKNKIKIRENNFNKLKTLWQVLTTKMIIEYDVDNNFFVNVFINAISKNADDIFLPNYRLKIQNIKNQTIKKESINSTANINTLTYLEFISMLATDLSLNINTIHNGFIEVNKQIGHKYDLNQFLNHDVERLIVVNVEQELIDNILSNAKVNYNTISTKFKETKLTDYKGNPLKEIDANSVGRLSLEESVNDNYLYDQYRYDSELEKENLENPPKEIDVYAKLPQRSIKIPIPGGKTYSPDFAYVIKENGKEKELNLVIETKGYDTFEQLSVEEKLKIKLANYWKDAINFNDVKINFAYQLENKKITDIIQKIRKESDDNE